MSREEFLNNLQEALVGRVSEQVVSENVNYYRKYIDEQVSGGKREEEVLAMLGDPRLLAKTIEGSSKFAREQDIFSNSAYSNGGYSNSNYSGRSYSGSGYDKERDGSSWRLRLPAWITVLIVVMCIVLIVIVVFRAFIFLAPLLIMLALVSLIIKALGKWLKF